MRYFADFETTVDLDHSKVWLWCVMDYKGKYKTGATVDEFMDYLQSLKDKRIKVEFFNLPFDGTYILHWLYENNFKYYGNNTILPFTFSTSISPMGIFYSISVKFAEKEVRFIDSKLLIGGSVGRWGEILGFPKGETPLKTNNDCSITESDIEYIKTDCDIVRQVKLSIRDKYNVESTTKATGAWRFFVYMKGEKWIQDNFPLFNAQIADRLREAVRGGLVCYNPFYTNKIITDRMWFYDFMSEYPFIMSKANLCYGHYTYKSGYHEVDTTDYMNAKEFAIYHGFFVLSLKPNSVPCLLVDGYSDMPTEYAGLLTITSNDLHLMKIAYNMEFEITESYVFKTKKGIFKDYIDRWIEEKKSAKGEPVLYEFTKIMMNALSGKPAERSRKLCKYPVFEEGKIKYRFYENDESTGIYSPISAHITSIGRRMLYERILEASIENWVYSDTDSIGSLVPLKTTGGNELGDLELEAVTSKWIVLGKKKYFMELEDGSVKAACVGMTKHVIKNMKIEEFKPGAVLKIRKMVQVVGGRSMKDVEYLLTGTKMPPDVYMRGGGELTQVLGEDEEDLSGMGESRMFKPLRAKVLEAFDTKCIVETYETPPMVYMGSSGPDHVEGEDVWVVLYKTNKGIKARIRPLVVSSEKRTEQPD